MTGQVVVVLMIVVRSHSKNCYIVVGRTGRVIILRGQLVIVP